ncbi:MAG: DUF72 domain-containing protein [Candidatus Bathyarchaeota archaeon]|nr:DUF72 domain-containing protein [Candidatus Bathyarchaeota archaeon]
MATGFFLGCSGFYYNHWRGRFYPTELAKAKWLEFYADQFNTLEINNTFYRYPTEKLLLSWKQRTPADFRFTLKANRAITHTRRFRGTPQLTETFYRLAHLLDEKLLCVLFQLPPSIQKDMALLETIADQMDTSVLNALEFRHRSWWSREVYDFLDRHQLLFCSVSVTDLPDEIVQTNGGLYVRFHGVDGWYGGNYPDAELQKWANRIRLLNPQKVLCYFNNDINAYAPANCQTLKRYVSAAQPLPPPSI